ncbi:MAG: serine hydrolase [Actinomycetota bacterium]
MTTGHLSGVLPPGPPPAVPLPAQDDAVAWPTTAWPTAEPDPSVAADLQAIVDEGFAEPTPDSPYGLPLALVVIHRGRLVLERYGPTAGPDEQLISWSMAKSITQALIGILVGQGQLDVDGPAPVPEWANADDPRRAITVDQLLRMVPGLRFNEDYVDADTSHCIEMLFGVGKEDMAAYAASQKLIAEPDQLFNYSSGNTNILCRILADAVGRGPDFEAWMREVLLDPIGMDGVLTFDKAGTWVGSSFLDATARDFAKFGLLYLRDGVWDGQRLLPEGWVDRARTHRATGAEGERHGAQWWLWPCDPDVFYASGYETQRIIVDPAADLVLVRLGKTPIERADTVDAWLERIRLAFPR